jgi:hypothetical protein
VIMNYIYKDAQVQEHVSNLSVKTAKFSFLKMMTVIWSYYVLRPLFDKFNEKVTTIILGYQKEMLKLVNEFETLEKTKKYFKNYIDSQYALNVVDSQVLKQSLNMVLDLSLNEYTIQHIGSSR